MSAPAGVAVPQRPGRRLDRQLSNIAAGRYTPDDFVIADAKDADMAFGFTAAGPVTGVPAGMAGPGRYRTRSEYLGSMRALVAQDDIDIGNAALTFCHQDSLTVTRPQDHHPGGASRHNGANVA